MSSSWPTHLVSIAPMRHLVYTRSIDHPVTPNPIDAPRPPQLACILRAIIITAMLDGASTSTALSGTVSSWHYHSKKHHAHAPLLRSVDVTSYEKHTLTTESTEYELRAYIQHRNNWTDNIYDSISWTAYLSAFSIVTGNVKTFELKLIVVPP
jgi:hypothetical protein